MKKSLSTGFIDPISLISLGIVVVGLVITTTIVKNPASLDIRNWARMIEGTDDTSIRSTRSTQPAKTTQAPVQTTPDQPSSQQDETPSQPETPVTPAEVRLEKKLCQAEGGTWSNNQCQFPETTTAPAAAQPTTQTQPSEESRFVAKQQAETQYFQTHPEQKPSPSPTAVPTTKCSSFGACYRETYTCEKEFGQLDCRDGFKCGIHCSAPAPPPPPAPITITKSDYQKCLDSGNTPSECSGIAANIGQKVTTPAGQKECDPAVNKPFCSGGNLKICSNSGTWGLLTCSNGCANNQCEPKVDSNAGLIATYNTLNAVTFGAFGNYVQTYQDINAQNPQASYLQQALNPQGIAASAQLGAVLTAEAAAAAAAGPAAQAIAGLPVAYLMAQNALAGSSTLQTAAAVATLSQFPAAIIACQTQGADSPACQYAAMGITAGYFTDPIGTLQGLQTSAQQVQNVANQGLNELSYASSILNLPNADNPAGWTLGTYGGQTPISAYDLIPSPDGSYRQALFQWEEDMLAYEARYLNLNKGISEGTLSYGLPTHEEILNMASSDTLKGLTPEGIRGSLYGINPHATSSQRYLTDNPRIGYEIALAQQRLGTQNLTCLDVGCSSGIAANTLQQAMPELQITGVDVVNQLEVNLPFIQTAGHNLQLPAESVDVIIAANMMGYLPADYIEGALLSELQRVLRPGGLLVGGMDWWSGFNNAPRPELFYFIKP